jgi:hypothetical protein
LPKPPFGIVCFFVDLLQVRGKLLAESKGAAQQEERKKQRQQKVFGKEARFPAPLFLLSF